MIKIKKRVQHKNKNYSQEQVIKNGESNKHKNQKL
jgi:hypothetical protein